MCALSAFPGGWPLPVWSGSHGPPWKAASGPASAQVIQSGPCASASRVMPRVGAGGFASSGFGERRWGWPRSFGRG
eukprot:3486333-Pyramimonas_sp.AAC.1